MFIRAIIQDSEGNKKQFRVSSGRLFAIENPANQYLMMAQYFGDLAILLMRFRKKLSQFPNHEIVKIQTDCDYLKEILKGCNVEVITCSSER